MPRPQKYTDSEIMKAIESLAAAGEIVNPMRVRMRLGGGNVTRIKALIEQQAGQLAQTAASMARLPDGLSKEFQRLAADVSQQMLLLANKCWSVANAEVATALREEAARLQKRLDAVEADLVTSTDLVVKLEAERDEQDRALERCLKERDELKQQCSDLMVALRNAESDLRATQRMIEAFERNQRQDRDEIRELQRRNENLVGEIATLKANLSSKTSSTAKRAPKSVDK